MKTRSFFKVLDKNTGLYSGGQQHYGSRDWTRNGHVYPNRAAAVNAIRAIGAARNDPKPEDVRLVELVYELVEVKVYEVDK